jgi:Flp pilus assembly pilin Flp
MVSGRVRHFLKGGRASSLLPYGLMVGLVAVVSIGAVSGLGGSVSDLFGVAETGMTEATGGTGGGGNGDGDGDDPEPEVTDTAPDAFSFTDVTDAEAGAAIDSNAVVLSGFDGSLTAVCGSGCTDIARNGLWAGATSLGGFVETDTIAIRQTASAGPLTETTAQVTVGDTASALWRVTTEQDLPDVNALVGTGTGTTWNYAGGGNPHDFDMIFPVEHRGGTVDLGRVYYRMSSTTAMVADGTISATRGGTALATVSGSVLTGVTPRGTSQTDNYLVFNFTGQSVAVPGGGTLWFRALRTSVTAGNKSPIRGAAGYSTTYFHGATEDAGNLTSFFIEIEN